MSLTDGRPQRVLLVRNRDQMNTIGHQTIPPDVHVVLPAPVAHQLNARSVVIVGEKRAAACGCRAGPRDEDNAARRSCDSAHALNDQSLYRSMSIDKYGVPRTTMLNTMHLHSVNARHSRPIILSW